MRWLDPAGNGSGFDDRGSDGYVGDARGSGGTDRHVGCSGCSGCSDEVTSRWPPSIGSQLS
ncbi:MAG: hypothetical protein ACRELY_04445 [Polyangiaceae bacterium]